MVPQNLAAYTAPGNQIDFFSFPNAPTPAIWAPGKQGAAALPANPRQGPYYSRTFKTTKAQKEQYDKDELKFLDDQQKQLKQLQSLQDKGKTPKKQPTPAKKLSHQNGIARSTPKCNSKCFVSCSADCVLSCCGVKRKRSFIP